MKTYECKVCGTEKRFHHSMNNIYCSVKCQAAETRNNRITEWLVEGKDWLRGVPAWIKDADGYLARERGYSCEVCGISEHNDKPIVLECDHIDGDHKNNRPENLRLVCPNCHSQTSTYKNKNKGNGMQFRRDRYHNGLSY